MQLIEDRLGLVELGSFVPFSEKKSVPATMRIALRLTSLPADAADPPETKELDLTPYEGRVLLVRGHLGGAWLHSAEIVEAAGQILTRVTLTLLS